MMLLKRVLQITLCIFLPIHLGCGQGLWCYKCVSTHPGCGTPFDWRWYWSYTCPHSDDKCVKIVERKGADEIITRDCLSSVQGLRRDIPADTYEGCRSAAADVRLAQYTFNDITELDIKRDHYDNTTFCFCDFDHFCNTASSFSTSLITLGFLLPMVGWRLLG